MTVVISELTTEVTTDPQTIGYSWLSDNSAILDLINSLATGRTLTRSSIKSAELFDAYDVTEFEALTGEDREDARWFIDVARNANQNGGEIGMNISPNSFGRGRLANIFGPVTETAALAALTETTSRAIELWGEPVTIDHIRSARP